MPYQVDKMGDFGNYIPVLVALIAGPAAVWVTARISKPKVQADATRTLTEISLSLVEPQMKRIEALETHSVEQDRHIANQDTKIDALERWARLLFAQVIEAGKTPMSFQESENLHNGTGKKK